MANKRIDQLPSSPGMLSSTLFETCRDPSGTKAHEKLSGTQLINFLAPLLGIAVYENTVKLLESTSHLDGTVCIVLGNASEDDGVTRAYRYASANADLALGLVIMIPNDVVRPATGSYIKISF